MAPAELEAIISADEEARVRVEAAQQEARARVEAAHAAREAATATRAEDVRRTLGVDLARIRDECQRQVDERQRRRAAFVEEHRLRGEARFDEAVAAFARLVRDGPEVTP